MRKFLQHSRKGSALLIGLIITILLSIMIISFFEKVLRVGKSVHSIQLSTQAYYNTIQGIEDVLNANIDLKKLPWKTQSKTEGKQYSADGETNVAVNTTSNVIPASGKGNSPFEDAKDWNLLSVNEPIQLVIPKGINWNNVEIYFRLPKTDTSSRRLEAELTQQQQFMFFSFGSPEKSFYWDNEKFPSITKFSNNQTIENIGSQNGIIYSQGQINKNNNFDNHFYQGALGIGGQECGDDYKCTFKISLLKPILTKDKKNIPFVEYKMIFNKEIPERFMTIDATSTIHEYQRQRTVRIPQITTNTALDFAVLQ